MRDTERRLRVNQSLEYRFGDDGLIIAIVKRGESRTRYKINPAIHEFLEKFREPITLLQVADEMAQSGFDKAQVLSFGKGILKTPLVEFMDKASTGGGDVRSLLQSFGFKSEIAFKNREFDGVFKVSDQNGRAFIVKIIHTPEPSVTDPIKERLRNEFRILKKLERIDGVMRAQRFVDSATPYMVGDFISGTRLHTQEERSLQSSLKMAAQVARTVAAMHEEGVIHGDLHSSNMLYDSSRNVTLIDFDCSYVQDESYRPRNGGAIHFLPPERVIGNWFERVTREADQSSDIYQAGVAIYNTLTGDMPYRGSTLSELAANIKTGKFRPLCKTRCGESIPAAVIDFVHRSIDADPAVRPTAMSEYPHDCA